MEAYLIAHAQALAFVIIGFGLGVWWSAWRQVEIERRWRETQLQQLYDEIDRELQQEARH